MLSGLRSHAIHRLLGDVQRRLIITCPKGLIHIKFEPLFVVFWGGESAKLTNNAPAGSGIRLVNLSKFPTLFPNPQFSSQFYSVTADVIGGTRKAFPRDAWSDQGAATSPAVHAVVSATCRSTECKHVPALVSWWSHQPTKAGFQPGESQNWNRCRGTPPLSKELCAYPAYS